MGIKLTFTLLHPRTCHIDEKSYYVALFAHFPFDHQLTFLSLVNIGKRNLCRYLSQRRNAGSNFSYCLIFPFSEENAIGECNLLPHAQFCSYCTFLDTLSLPTIDGIPSGCKSSASTPYHHTQSWECFCIGFKGPSTLATLFNHMWPRIVAGIFIPVGNHYFQALASTLQFVAQVCDRLWLVPATDRAFAYITYMSPPHVALVCSGPPQCAATCG